MEISYRIVNLIQSIYFQILLQILLHSISPPSYPLRVSHSWKKRNQKTYEAIYSSNSFITNVIFSTTHTNLSRLLFGHRFSIKARKDLLQEPRPSSSSGWAFSFCDSGFPSLKCPLRSPLAAIFSRLKAQSYIWGYLSNELMLPASSSRLSSIFSPVHKPVFLLEPLVILTVFVLLSLGIWDIFAPPFFSMPESVLWVTLLGCFCSFELREWRCLIVL